VLREGYALVRCPWHKGGRGANQSLRVRLTPYRDGYRGGDWICYSCASDPGSE
jgi:hypothetical protein